jgi:hypothetical protein
MMDDSTPEGRTLSAGERWSAIVFLLVLVGLFVAEVMTNYHPAKLTALFIVLFWIPLLVFHETGHAVMAAMLGLHIHRVVIGLGPRFARFRVAGIPVELHLVPAEGFVQVSPRNLRAPQLKMALCYFAGPGATLLILGALAIVPGVETLLTATDHLVLLAWQSLAVAALLSTVISLVPYPVYEPGRGRMVSDGLGIIESLTRSTKDYAQRIDRSPEEPWSEDPEAWKD